MKILLIDDDSEFLSQAEHYLKKEDERLNIQTANTAKEALKLLEKNNIDAIVSDYKLSKTTGLDLLETIRKEENNNIPFILFTGKGREEVAMEALNLGADHYLMKGGKVKLQFEDLAGAIINEVNNNSDT